MTAAVLDLRPLQTAFDPDDGPLTLATPSCCCCCCCCIATVVGAITYGGRDAYLKAQHGGVAEAAPVAVALLALPAAFLLFWFGIWPLGYGDSPFVWVGAAAALYVALTALAHGLAETSGGGLAGLRRVILIGAIGFAEFWLVLFTVGFVWLLTPVFLMRTWRRAGRNNGLPDRRKRDRRDMTK